MDHKWVVDVRSGFQGKIFHWGWAKCTAIFILRKQNCSLLSRGKFRHCVMNSYSCLHYSLWSKRLRVLVCGRLAPQAINNDIELIVNSIHNVQLGEPLFHIRHDLWEINIVQEEIHHLNLKLGNTPHLWQASRDNSSIMFICLQCLNGSNILFKYCIYGGTVNITTLIEVDLAEFQTQHFLCLQICIER